jgi:hypothetical protein
MLPLGYDRIELASYALNNFYDGTLVTDDGVTPYVTDAYRQGIIAGYDPTYKEVWFQMRVNRDTADGGGNESLCFRINENREWNIRKLNTTYAGQGATGFTQRSDGTMSIVTGSSILKYPNRDGAFPYEDNVTVVDAAGSGYDTEVQLQLGSLSGIVRNISIIGMQADFVGASIDGLGLISLNLYANRESVAFDTHYKRIDTPTELRRVRGRGNMEALRVKITLPSTTANFKRFDVSSITILYVENNRQGNI